MLLEIVLGLIILLLIYSYFELSSRERQLANKIPGPPRYPIIGNLPVIPFFGPGAMDNFSKLIKTYGPVLRICVPNLLVVMISSAEDFEAVLSNSVLLEKPKFYEFLHNWLGSGLLTSFGTKWHKRRKALTPAFHFKILEQFIDIFNEKGNILIDCLKKEDGKDEFDLQPYITKYTLDVLCDTAMDAQLNIQTDFSSKYLDAFMSILNQTSDRMNKPWLHNNLMYAISGNLRKENSVLKILRDLSDEIIINKQKILEEELKKNIQNKQSEDDLGLGIKKKTAFLELLLRKKLEGSDTFITNADIREEVDTFIFEGHDTTKSALCFALHSLAKYPDIQNKIYEEQMDILGPDNKTPTYEDLQKLKYLECVIKEVLRLYPPVPLIGRRVTREFTLPSGYTLPVNTVISICIFHSNRNEKYFPNPLKFNPDNFAKDSSSRHAYSYIPFSAGPRNCIGQKFAMLEMKAILSKLVRNYHFELKPGSDIEIDARLILISSTGFKVKLRSR